MEDITAFVYQPPINVVVTRPILITDNVQSAGHYNKINLPADQYFILLFYIDAY